MGIFFWKLTKKLTFQDYLELLGGASEIILDKDVYKNAPETTEEVEK